MKIKDALSKFYVKLGGSPTDINADDTSGDILEKISDVYTDKEGTHVEVATPVTEGTKIATVKTNNEDHDIYAPKELPDITSADEGLIAAVNSLGNWDKVDMGKIKVVDVTVDSDDFVLPEGVTVANLVDLYTNGYYVILRNARESGGGTSYKYFMPVYAQNYYNTSYNSGGINYIGIGYSKSGIDVDYLYMSIIVFTSTTSETRSSQVIEVDLSSTPSHKVSGTLEAGQTTIELPVKWVHEDSVISVDTSIYGVQPTNIVKTYSGSLATHKIELTFPVQSEDMRVTCIVFD